MNSLREEIIMAPRKKIQIKKPSVKERVPKYPRRPVDENSNGADATEAPKGAAPVRQASKQPVVIKEVAPRHREPNKLAAHAIQPARSLEESWQRYRPQNWSQFICRLDRSGIPYLSHSKLTRLESCPRCYYREYILGEKQESDALRRGTLFHHAAKIFYAALKNGQRIKPAVSAQQIRANSLPDETLLMLRNALKLLQKNQWEKHDILAVEDCFFMDLAPGLPPIIGVPDLVLSRGDSLIIVDHKTSKSFNNLDSSQLILYAEFFRRKRSVKSIIGVFDEYRLVTDLAKINKSAFRRTPVGVDHCFLPKLIVRYRRAWKEIVFMQKNGEPKASPDCWTCNQASYSSW